ncbi:hypothetical protein BZA05DRAFT_400681 [Tricharina praecox]|uniref:uncharacterized protein n=1 Tax=Tricharina praecox TaxID=43433 RepID=UPI0022210AB6|nr:uncharacterized protein BZA05DRAFT_400681 [Tricharina praecox]KAI5850031.1 hypothetical protein BZA05DRAFT_400681 [Tricharina praecox]
MVCKYTYIGDAPLPPGGGTDKFNPATAITSERVCRTVPLVDCQILDQQLFPSHSKNSLRLAYFTHPQFLSLCFPMTLESNKYKISCPATLCRIERDEERLRVSMKLADCQFSVAGPEATSSYSDSPQLEQWVLKTTIHKGGELHMICKVLGNAFDEEGSGARLAHQFAEHVVHASSAPPPPYPSVPRNRCQHPRGRGGDLGYRGGGGGGGRGGARGGGKGGGGARWSDNTYGNGSAGSPDPHDRRYMTGGWETTKENPMSFGALKTNTDKDGRSRSPNQDDKHHHHQFVDAEEDDQYPHQYPYRGGGDGVNRVLVRGKW